MFRQFNVFILNLFYFCELSVCYYHCFENLTSRVKAMNRLGESSWSEYGSVTTLIDAARIPRVSGLSWDNETSSLGFQVTRVYPLYLVARVEARMERLGTTNNTWQLIKTVPLKKKPFAFLLPRNLKFNNLR